MICYSLTIECSLMGAGLPQRQRKLGRRKVSGTETKGRNRWEGTWQRQTAVYCAKWVLCRAVGRQAPEWDNYDMAAAMNLHRMNSASVPFVILSLALGSPLWPHNHHLSTLASANGTTASICWWKKENIFPVSLSFWTQCGACKKQRQGSNMVVYNINLYVHIPVLTSKKFDVSSQTKSHICMAAV